MQSLAHNYVESCSAKGVVVCLRCRFESRIADLGDKSAFCVPHNEKSASGFRDYDVGKMRLVRSTPLIDNSDGTISINIKKLSLYHRRKMFPLTEARSGRREVSRL